MATLPNKSRRRNRRPNKTEQETFAFGEALMKPPVPLHQNQQERSWLEITPEGTSTSLVLLTKLKTIQHFQLPLRDLRIVDPMLATSYPSALLAREKSIIDLYSTHITNALSTNLRSGLSIFKKNFWKIDFNSVMASIPKN